MSVGQQPGASELEGFYMVQGLPGQEEAWQRYVAAVREVAEDVTDPLQPFAQHLLAGGLDEQEMPEEDAEGFGLDEPAEGEG